VQKGFIVATLVSTLVGTFSASMALADKIQEKRDKSKQKSLDGKQDGEIKVLQEKIKQLEIDNGPAGDKNGGRKEGCSRSHSRSSSGRRRRRRDNYDDDEHFAHSARRSRAMIEQAYEENLMRIGQGYAQGDGGSLHKHSQEHLTDHVCLTRWQ